MIKFLDRLIDSNEKQIKKLEPKVEEINSLEPQMKKLKDADFPAKTASFKQRLSSGEILDDLLPETFALVREAINRVVGQRAFDVQLMAAISLHQGKIIEQRTGEGKTLSAAMAAYLNGLTGKGVHVVTVNDYLARRDAGWYGEALSFAGLSMGCIVHDQAFVLDLSHKQSGQSDERLRHLKPVSRREAYLVDVTYGTNNEYGFDYLRDNMAVRFEDQVQRGHHFAVVDEVDSILIDEARTPLIISAPDTEPTNKYYEFANLIKTLSPDTDFVIDEKLKSANLTDHGLRKVEKRLGVDNLYEKDFDTIKHIENSLRARTHFLRDRDYVVKDDQVIIVDEFTGRLMHGRRWSDGLHQSVEAKEGVKIQQESITMATISFQNYFRMYQKLSGMTGTAATEAEEFEKIYQLETLVIPTNLPMVRDDRSDVVYKSVGAKYQAVVEEIEEHYQKGQPVLVGTTSIEKNEIVAKFLKKRGIPHNVLNAKQHEKEAGIISEAGRKKAVTVATNMAGRGVDIVLGGSDEGRVKKEWQKDHDEVISLGGLHVLGTERHESRRIDNQLRGRSGRQGDPGSSRFFISLEDDIMRIFGGEQVSRIMTALKIPENQPIEHKMISKAIETAQSRVEGFHFDARKRVVEYDDVMNKHREIIYAQRKQLLEKDLAGSKKKGEVVGLKAEVLEKMGAEVSNIVAMHAPSGLPVSKGALVKTDYGQIVKGFCEILPFDHGSQARLQAQLEKAKNSEKIIKLLIDLLTNAYEKRESQLGTSVMRDLERIVYLRTMDRLWVNHIDAMDDLREGIGLRGDAKTALAEYKKEAYGMFESLMGAIDDEIVRRIFRVHVGPKVAASPLQGIKTNIDQQDGMGLRPSPSAGSVPPIKSSSPSSRSVVSHSGKKKIGRNDPCWCGAKNPNTKKPYKYKKCGLINAPHHQG
ncbi:preprotein translocase subunit SecA [Patescibacteria group bacterium]